MKKVGKLILSVGMLISMVAILSFSPVSCITAEAAGAGPEVAS